MNYVACSNILCVELGSNVVYSDLDPVGYVEILNDSAGIVAPVKLKSKRREPEPVLPKGADWGTTRREIDL